MGEIFRIQMLMNAEQTEKRKGVGWAQGVEVTILDWVTQESSLGRC